MTQMDASQEVLTFDSNTSGWMSTMRSGEDTTMHVAQTSDTNDAFLGRPVKIATIPWAVGSELHVTFDPWSLFFNNSKVINRIAHFKNLRATLNVKFQLNGSPFYYGRLMASYNPLPNSDDITTFRIGVPSDRIAASQRPKVFLDPCTSQGGEIQCPFIFPKNTIDIPSGEWDKMGNITLATLNGLQHSNDNTDPITITVFAYCTDYDLSTPTSLLPPTIVPQMGKGKDDEYGVISGPAHTIANWSGKLSLAPTIGPYARATQMFATGVGAVASLFGFSKPREVDNNKSTINGNVELAVTNTPDLSLSLALDAKKEITIDPTVTGAGNQDEMALVPLACKESYLTSFTWNASQFTDTHLFSVRVRPTQGDINTTDGAIDEVHMTPSSWVSLPFEYWTGSMEFRFQIVCSAYHRGRLRFVWDPDYYTGSDYNVNYSQIVDISNVKDAKVKVGWGANTSYLPVSTPIANASEQPLFPSFSTNPYTSSESFGNGTLSVFVVNELTSPSSSGETIEVNVFTNASDDFEVAGPTCDYIEKFIASDDNDYNPDPDNPRNPGGNPPPDSGPISAPNPDGSFPTDPGGDPDPGDMTLVMKSVDPFAVVHALGVVTGQERPFDFPQWTNTIGVATNRAFLVNETHSYKLFGRGNPSGTSGISQFRFFNPSANPRDITITVNSEPPVTGTLPGFIGAEVTLDVPVSFSVQDWGFNVVEIAVAGSGGRIILENVGTIMKPEEDTYQYPLSVIEATSPDFVSQGDHLLNVGADDNGGVLAPPGVEVGMPHTWVHRTPMVLNSVTFDNTVTFGNDAIPAGSVWQDVGGLVGSVGVTDPGNPKADIYDFYTVATMQPEFEEYRTANKIEPPIVPEMDGVEGEDHEEVNAPEIEQPTLYMGPPCVSGPSNQVYFGEQVSSWRQVLKRASGGYQFTCTSGGGPSTLVLPQLPTFVGDITSTTSEAIDISGSIYRWVKNAYVCERGGFRIKLLGGIGNRNSPEYTSVHFTRIPTTTTLIPSNVREFSNTVSFCGFGYSFPLLNGHAEAEIPWYSNYRFLPARSQQFSDPANYVERQQVEVSFGHVTGSRVAITYSAAEDYMVSNFLSVPIFLFAES